MLSYTKLHKGDIICPLPNICNHFMVCQGLIYVIKNKDQISVPMSHYFEMAAILLNLNQIPPILDPEKAKSEYFNPYTTYVRVRIRSYWVLDCLV